MTHSEKTFIQTVKRYYKKHGRHDLPWRKTNNPYRILVSEMMLQQTQVSRVIPKYRVFLKQFPTIQALAHAPLKDVLALWQGLGYNRRAKFLHDCAKVVVHEYNRSLPTDLETLCRLPGIGPYTAGAVYVFATNKPEVIIETNIRTVFLYHFFSKKKQVFDREILEYVERTLDMKNPREWYWALMDYGAHLKTKGIRTHRNSKHYTKQSKFKGSNREVRGAILRILTEKNNATVGMLVKETGLEKNKIQVQLHNLQKEKIIQSKKRKSNVQYFIG
jgi:A/G-specific adenine glycosylase